MEIQIKQSTFWNYLQDIESVVAKLKTIDFSKEIDYFDLKDAIQSLSCAELDLRAAALKVKVF